MDTTDKVIITGAPSGIGAATAPMPGAGSGYRDGGVAS